MHVASEEIPPTYDDQTSHARPADEGGAEAHCYTKKGTLHTEACHGGRLIFAEQKKKITRTKEKKSMQFSLQREDMKSQPRKKIRAFPAKKIRAFPAKKIHAFVVEEKLEIHAFVVENKTKQNKNSALSWSEHTLQTILLF